MFLVLLTLAAKPDDLGWILKPILSALNQQPPSSQNILVDVIAFDCNKTHNSVYFLQCKLVKLIF